MNDRTVVFHFLNKGTLKLISYDVSDLISSVFKEEIILQVIWVYLTLIQSSRIEACTYWNEERPETAWNQLKPAETTKKLPETTWNHFKPTML